MTQTDPLPIVIIGAGIGGLTLATAIHQHASLTPTVYEQAPLASFSEGTGGAIGLYANGLAVLRGISDHLLDDVCAGGLKYQFRRWRRHDGSEIGVGDETLLVPAPKSASEPSDPRLEPIGIRRWKLQAALLNEAQKRDIPVHFDMRLEELTTDSKTGVSTLRFKDGTVVAVRVVFGADGVKSRVRHFLFPEATEPEYTGVTTLMAVAKMPPPTSTNPAPLSRGIHFISSVTTKCHACMYPLPNNELTIQLYLPTPANPESWGKLSPTESATVAADLVARLRRDGWNETFIQPFVDAEVLIRVGLRAREPLREWCARGDTRATIALLGDAAHPPVPYIGQGAMQAIEDAGVLALLLKRFPLFDGPDGVDAKQWQRITRLYERIRVDRCTQVLRNSHVLGEMNQRRADSWIYNLKYEWSIWAQVLFHGNLPIMLEGVRYRYDEEVDKAVALLEL